MRELLHSIGNSPGCLGALWEALFFDSGCQVLLLTRDSVIVDLNPDACQFLQGTREQLMGARLANMYPDSIRDAFLSWLNQAIVSPDEVASQESVFRGSRWLSKARCVSQVDGEQQVLCVSQKQTNPIPTQRLHAMIDRYHDRRVALGDLANLTEREFEVAALIGAFMSDGEIAQALHRSIRTVHAHRRGIGQKTGLHRRSEIAELMQTRGLAVAPAANAGISEKQAVRTAA